MQIKCHMAETPEDKEACLAIRRHVFIEEQQVPESRERDGEDAKALHFLAYAALAVLAAGTIALARRWTAALAAGLGAALATFAMVDELTQPLFTRAAEPLDWIFDCIGIGLGIAAVAAAVAGVRIIRGR